MFGWLRRKTESADPEQARALYQAIRSALAEPDEDTVRIVASVAALLLCVSYADLDYTPSEERLTAATLARIRGLDARGVEAILQTLREHVVSISSMEASSYGRELLDLTDEPFRRELLDVLLDVAAADDEVTVSETNLLRNIARSLGLSQALYNASQDRHRAKLAVLKS